MYSYTYDGETGGITLNSTPTGFSKEPRPVYAPELTLFNFNKYWKYDRQTDLPYMWAEANKYYYRGLHVATLRGGNLFTAPEIEIPPGHDGGLVLPEPMGKELRPIDIKAMVAANYEMLEIIEQDTVKKIVAAHKKWKGELDCFHVAFSGGKDSCVLLDLVKKALPKGSFVVVFGDTGMEFPDTYDVIEKTKIMCNDEDIPFYTAKSHLEPKDSWLMFGPPSRALRWCCSVHKTAPQTLKLREVTGKKGYKGMAFVGVRTSESATRAEYEFENDGIKQKGQRSHNSILEWTSAEVWQYIYANNIIINEAYKKGNSRAGCLFCPMSVNKADYIKRKMYYSETEMYINLIKKTNGRNYGDDSYISKGGWVSRRSGRDLIDNTMNYSEIKKDGILTITVTSPRSDWREWLKTLGLFGDIPLKVKKSGKDYTVQLPESYTKNNPTFGKLFKQIFRKATYCVKCKVCEANCSSGCLCFENGLKITDCTYCIKCHDIEDGCLVYNSLRLPKMEKTMSINNYDTTLPKKDWFTSFFKKKHDFWNAHELGINQVKTFKSFLRHSGLTEKNEYSALAKKICNIGWETDVAWGIILINLAAESSQFRWYITKLEIERSYPRDTVLSMLFEYNNSINVVKHVYSAFGKLVELPLGTVLNFGHVTNEGDLVRTKCSISDSRVVLYGLFKFAEKCGDYKQFTLSALLSDGIERDGISPTRIFGLGREDIIPILLGLSARHPDFILASFTHDLEKITLAEDKTSRDVLDLFKED